MIGGNDDRPLIERVLIARLHGIDLSLASLATPNAPTMISFVGDGQSVAVFDPQTGWVLVSSGPRN